MIEAVHAKCAFFVGDEEEVWMIEKGNCIFTNIECNEITEISSILFSGKKGRTT